MAVDFQLLQIGQTYDRPYLAKLWGYEGYQGLSRGVVTPRGSGVIILFVTKEKQESLTQYSDYLDGSRLIWEGEQGRGSDRRIVEAGDRGEEIHLFYRERHHSPFVYYGVILLKEHALSKSGPSKFVFHVPALGLLSNPIDDLGAFSNQSLTSGDTETDSIVRSRIGQGTFRMKVIELWGSCSVTGVRDLSLLRASHIKPWRASTNAERLDPYNGLLLHPLLDHLFDNGFITFDHSGAMIVSSRITSDDRDRLQLDSSLMLRIVPEKTREYLNYHREHVFIV